MSVSKIVAAAASSAGGAGLDVDECFSTTVYDGTGSAQTITNNIDLSGEGGLVWVKKRSGSANHTLQDTERGATKHLRSSGDSSEATEAQTITAFNSNGFSLGTDDLVNASNSTYVSWTFRNSPIFQVVKYTGTGGSRTLNHNLNSTIGMIIVKDYSNGGENWTVYHRGIDVNGDNAPETDGIYLNTTGAAGDESGFWNDTAPTSTQFTVGGNLNSTFGGGANYVAYLFAHNDSGDGGFGPDGDADIIKCGSYTGNAGNPQLIELGFEPQFLMVKCASHTGDWFVVDNMRGVLPNADYGDANKTIYWNTNAAEIASGNFGFYSTGFAAAQSSSTNGSGRNFIYMAIRRGPLAAPDDATKVFAVDAFNSSDPRFTSGFPVDMAIATGTSSTNHNEVQTRLLGNSILKTSSTSSETPNQSHIAFDYQTGHNETTYWNNTGAYSWMWKRAPSYFDCVGFLGTGSARTVPHGLTVPPEMMWLKNRSSGTPWMVYHSALGNQAYLQLNGTNAQVTGNTSRWNATTPTASVFSVGDSGSVNGTSNNIIAYLFATVPNVSFVGSYTGNGSSQNIDCGFSSGARFVLIKRYDGTDSWYVADSVRGISSGQTDKILKLNSTDAEFTESDNSADYIAPHASGFNLPANSPLNGSGDDFIFYAIA